MGYKVHGTFTLGPAVGHGSGCRFLVSFVTRELENCSFGLVTGVGSKVCLRAGECETQCVFSDPGSFPLACFSQS